MNLGAIEAGGTKFVLAVGNEEGEILEKKVIPTEHPSITMPAVIDFFRGKDIERLGVGSFGPIDVNADSAFYGQLQKTPKTEWVDYPLGKELQDHLLIPVIIDTDVNVAAMSEAKWGDAKDVDSCLYITVGTGIGAGAYIKGETLRGLSHPEMGHIPVRRHSDDDYAGGCPYHGDCLEGMAAGPHIEKRWGRPAEELVDRKEVWEMEAYYLAQALVNYIYIVSPERIILGGGVMKQKQLFPMIRTMVLELLNGYVSSPYLTEDTIDKYIVSPGLTDEAGVKGALYLAMGSRM
ncbi:fructokinase [Salimicrobium jeotgali]|uniref:fructokinase n=1 Tax=Salimicrobium jeotgali TaxID=1230341 RepID=K2GFB7_9BACI|nr:ROK family protein [Salimicrobium jeotgali]AKG03862.1 fructokinase [Salimicrobium jeotgali]EKE32887.1 Fructokinase [Salimicrobium jeotgali]MBM7695120.1 fructokinase [Salimicrobium jeotgali]